MTSAADRCSGGSRIPGDAPARTADLRRDRLKPSSLTRDALRRLRQNPGAIAGRSCCWRSFCSRSSPGDRAVRSNRSGLAGDPARPAAHHLFGADNFGRDVFSRVLYGGRQSLPVGFVAVFIGAVIGVTAVWWPGISVARSTRHHAEVDVMLAFPGILLALAIVAILGTSLINLMIAVGISIHPGVHAGGARQRALRARNRIRHRGPRFGRQRPAPSWSGTSCRTSCRPYSC